MFKFLNQYFAQLRFWKSVSDSQNLLNGATAVLLETQEFKNLNILPNFLSLVFLLISNLTNGLRLHQFLGNKTTETNKSLKTDANRAH